MALALWGYKRHFLSLVLRAEGQRRIPGGHGIWTAWFSYESANNQSMDRHSKVFTRITLGRGVEGREEGGPGTTTFILWPPIF